MRTADARTLSGSDEPATPDLTDTHREIQTLAREFAQAEIAPHAARVERWRTTCPWRSCAGWASWASSGIDHPRGVRRARGSTTPRLALVIEEVAAADAGTSTGLAVQNSLTGAPIVQHGHRGAEGGPPARASPAASVFAAYALTEPGVGSDTANLRTTATADGDGYLVSGAKQWITNGGFAELFVLFARTGGPGAKGVSAFLAAPGEGFTVGPRDPEARPAHLLHGRAGLRRPPRRRRARCSGPRATA